MSAKEKQTCGFCRWFDPNYPEASSGCCRRSPPRVVSDARDGMETVWPEVVDRHFCGEWTPKASKTAKTKEVMQ